MQAARSSSDSNSTGFERSRRSPYILSARFLSVSSHHAVGRCVGMPMRVETELFASIAAREHAEKGDGRSNAARTTPREDPGPPAVKPSVRFDAEVAGEDFAPRHEPDLDAEVLAGRREPGQGEEEGEVEPPPGLQAGGIGEHPALARLPGALVALRIEEDHLQEGTRFRGSLPRLKALVADFEVEEDLAGLRRARHDDRLRRMEHQRQRDVAGRFFLRQVASQHVDTPFERNVPETPRTA